MARFIQVLTAVLVTLLLAGISATETTGTAQHESRRHFHRTRDNQNQSGSDDHKDKDHRSFREKYRRYDPEEFRKLLKVELEHIPTLDTPMDRLMEIQSERYALQKERHNIKADKSDDRSREVARFHQLLKKDMQLSEESRRIVKDISGSMDSIQKEIDARDKQLQDQLTAENSKPGNAQTSSTAAENLRRSQRCLDFLNRKLNDLESRPERMDLLSRMLKGIPMDDSPRSYRGSRDDSSDDTLDELQARKRHLQHELRELEKDIEKKRKENK